MIRIWSAIAAAVLASSVTAAFAAQPAQTVTSTDLKAKPEPKASTLATLSNGSALLVGERRGGWYAADTAQGKGWVRLLHVRLAGASATTGKDGVDTLVKLGSASRTDTTVATGIRGLTADDLKQAKENPRELAKLDAFAVSDNEARQFAAQGNVSSKPARKE
jgi:hypothetical protein